jgi:hypothetical protein
MASTFNDGMEYRWKAINSDSDQSSHVTPVNLFTSFIQGVRRLGLAEFPHISRILPEGLSYFPGDFRGVNFSHSSSNWIYFIYNTNKMCVHTHTRKTADKHTNIIKQRCFPSNGRGRLLAGRGANMNWVDHILAPPLGDYGFYSILITTQCVFIVLLKGHFSSRLFLGFGYENWHT